MNQLKRHYRMFLLALGVVVMLLISTVAYQVDFTEYALIKTFGRTTARIDGRDQAGLKFKWPWPIQRLVRYDARTTVFEDTASEVATSDKQNLLVTMYCAWRIADPVLFHRTITTVPAAQDRLRDLMRSAKKDVVGRHNMEDLINTDPSKMQIPRIEEEVLQTVREQAMGNYGADVVRVGIKSLALPKEVTTVVIEAMKEERQRDVRKFEAAGEAQATAIRERAKSASGQILAFANRKAAEIRSEGDRAAATYYKEFARNEPFSMFLRSLESLKTELEAKTVILLDGSELPAVEFFRTGPSLKRFESTSQTIGKPQGASAAPTDQTK
jgi:membrane protease subunit HflC